MQKLSGKWAILGTLLSFLVIGCAGTGKDAPKTEQAAQDKAAAADAKIPPSARQQYDEAIAAMRSGNIASLSRAPVPRRLARDSPPLMCSCGRN